MLLILMRLVEPFLEEDMDMEKYNAPLVIDGLDCVRMGLFDLRSKIGIIPQSPVLFSGTIRSNMVSQFSCFIQLLNSTTTPFLMCFCLGPIFTVH